MGIPQTSYDRAPSGQLAGEYEGDARIESMLNDEGSDIEPGLGVALKSAGKIELVDALTDKVYGITLLSFARNPDNVTSPNTILNGAMCNIGTDGVFYVVTEETVAAGDPVYCRHTSKGGNTVLGRFRNDLDGVAQVTTVTPTAANTMDYALRVSVGSDDFTFNYTSDGSGTATEVCDGFRTLMAANAEFTALIVATGTATLILTGQNLGQAFSVEDAGDGDYASITLTTAPAPSCVLVKGAEFINSVTNAGVAKIRFSRTAALS